MTEGEKQDVTARAGEHRPHRVRLPGFVTDESIGLGDAVKRVTSTMGVRKPCGGCEQRAAALNRWLVFSTGRGHRS
ncbi:hypothetical protein PV726_46060 [Streptomyces europaeiscabiei]|uniref:hypothetical protein n=1 Tax=Streptomyces europaeiscabiei TaxID=146819 RepID=UPI0029A20B59|nr:hypothetical protein [Streptomyces europaeiscabiei]MDX3697445.1 hypothetical protein [Streptomyces europaeiscabiei]